MEGAGGGMIEVFLVSECVQGDEWRKKGRGGGSCDGTVCGEEQFVTGGCWVVEAEEIRRF